MTFRWIQRLALENLRPLNFKLIRWDPDPSVFPLFYNIDNPQLLSNNKLYFGLRRGLNEGL
jgi:hypothetical protein